ncbi:hypothetical protein K402DRAFT_339257 [Aulographum hederae CBS 113979]|uniref:Pre-rRNA processing protein n=1 Tax=Aulographum hederae CBS 113979 TaxID=1176131 RepID=A0A6G1GPX7_9PEZI|nr:hypothetical protein K402DRAFT_339257 [Aulographum hederae CBS 113979]
MADSSAWGDSTTQSSRPASTQSKSSSKKANRSSEHTPLLQRTSSDIEDDERPERPSSSAANSLLRALNGSDSKSKTSSWRWPSIIALFILCAVAVVIIVLGFITPHVVEEYTMQAMDFQPTSLSIPSFTSSGVQARVQGNFIMDASKVKNKPVRDLGKFGTWIASEVESKESKVKVYLPEYGNVVLGTATIPPIKVNVRNGRITPIDFVADLQPGKIDGIRQVANDWVDGRLGQLRVLGVADVPLKSGIFSLGTRKVKQALLFAGNDIPAMPKYNISKLNVHEVDLPDGNKGVAADVSITVKNDFPLDFTVPPLGFGILVDNCTPKEDQIMVADATTGALHIKPYESVHVKATGVVRTLPDTLTSACPKSDKSPLDAILGNYIHGHKSIVYVRGSDSPSLDTPKWITDIISDITVPVPLAGRTFGNLIRNFTLADVHFKLPQPFADPDSPESNPMISAIIKVLVNLPREMNFPVDVDHVRANATVYYKKKELGILNLRKWQAATSSRVEPVGDEPAGLLVESAIENAPLEITDDEVFTDVLQSLIFGGKTTYLDVKAEVDVEVETALGTLAIKRIPAEGVVPVKLSGDSGGGGFSSFSPKIGNLSIIDTNPSGLVLQAEVNFTNPTNYSATVPFVDIEILTNDTVLGHAKATDVLVVPGRNEKLIVQAVWDPLTYSGEKGKAVGKEILSQYISGLNTTLTLKTHKNTLPSQPALGKALSFFNVTIPTPSLRTPKDPDNGDDPDDPDDRKTHFIQSTTMHLLTSTAVFELLSPLSRSTIFLTHINATAYYKDDVVGKIIYDLPFAIPPGESTSPRLPVDWSLGSVGYEAVRKALGGTLKLHAEADVGIKLGEWEQEVWFAGKGIGAKVRL